MGAGTGYWPGGSAMRIDAQAALEQQTGWPLCVAVCVLVSGHG